MITRRTLLTAVAGAGALAAVTPSAANAAGPVYVGATVNNMAGGAFVPMSDFQADIDRLVALGCNAVRMSAPLWLAGDVWRSTWVATPARLAALREQVQHCRSRGLFICLTVASPVIDTANGSFDNFLYMNRQAMSVIAAAVGADVDMWQLFNEWNMFHHTTHQPMALPLSDAYISEVRSLFTAFAPVLHQARWNTCVTSAVGGYPSVQSMWNYWESLYTWTGASLDAWGVIAYPDPSVPSQWPAQAALLGHMRSVSGKPVAVLETGMCTPTPFMADQAVSAVPGMLRGLAGGAPVALFLYQLRDRQTGSSDKEMNFGAYTTDGSRKKHWQATHDAIVGIISGTP